MKQVEGIRVENVVLPYKPLSNFELLEAVKKIKNKKFSSRVSERHSANKTLKKRVWHYEP